MERYFSKTWWKLMVGERDVSGVFGVLWEMMAKGYRVGNHFAVAIGG